MGNIKIAAGSEDWFRKGKKVDIWESSSRKRKNITANIEPKNEISSSVPLPCGRRWK